MGMVDLIGIIVPIRKLLDQGKQSLIINGNPIGELHENREYSVPDFQREIRWNEDNVSLLIDDLRNGERFLGNIILTRHSNTNYSIIDGQQRLTIITMIIHCISRLHGTCIDVLEPCELTVNSFSKLKELILSSFTDELVDMESVKQSDKLKQIDKYRSLWNYIISHKIISDQSEASILLRNLERSEVNLIINQSDDIKDGIRYFIDVNLKGKQLDPEDIFKSYLFKNDSSDSIRSEWYRFKKNVVQAESMKIQYSLLKYIEHYFYCDLYKDEKYRGLEFNDEFRLKKEFKTKEGNSRTFRKDSHLIEIIANKQYMLNSFKRLNSAIEVMVEIAESSGPSERFKGMFPCVSPKGVRGKLDSKELIVIHNIMKKILRDPYVLPKALLMKYILSVLDGKSKSKDEYKKIYGVYLLTVLFVVFENKKSKDVLLGILKSDDDKWFTEAISQIKSYFSSDRGRITDNRLLAQYKLGTNEEEEDYRFRCKSLATVYNFFKIKDDKVTITNIGELKEFLENDTEYSLEHFIISEPRSRCVKVQIKDQMVEYIYEDKFFKRYVNSMFNYIYITEQLNTDLGNDWLPTKEMKIQDGDEIKCEYSKMVISLSSMTISKALKELSLTTNNYKDRLDLFFSRDFKSIYIDYSRQVLEAVIEKIKNA